MSAVRFLMTRRHLVWLTIAAAMLPACQRDKSESAGAASEQKQLVQPNATPVEWPERPTDGSDLHVAFVEMIGSGPTLGARMRVFNFAETPVTALELELRYLDGSGTVLGSQPFVSRSRRLVAARGQALLPMGGSTPPATRRIEARVSYVARGEAAWGDARDVPVIETVSPAPEPPSAAPPTESP